MKSFRISLLLFLLVAALLLIGCSDNGDVPLPDEENTHTHELVEYVARDVGCMQSGYVHHFKCEKCGEAFSDAEGTTKITGDEIIISEGHKMSDAVCTVCGLETDRNLYYRGYKNDSGKFLYSVVSGVGKSEEEHVIIPSFVHSANQDIVLEQIEPGSFKSASGIKTIYIPKSVKTIAQNAFRECKDLEAVIFEDGSQCTSILASAFRDCKKLEYVSFGNNSKLTTLGSNAFRGCTRLAAVSFGEASLLEEIPEYCFDGCVSLTELDVPDSVVKVGARAFADCSHLSRLEFSEGLYEISDLSFKGCVNITEISLPSGLLKIGNYAFSGCESLGEIYIPSSVRNIGSNAFEKCDNLSITLGKGILTQNFNPSWNSSGLPTEEEK